MKKVGIMGGTFDPIHLGHLLMAQFSLEQLELDEVVFIPSGRPPHKAEGEVSSGEDRGRMTQLAVSFNPSFCVSEIELKKNGFTYTYDTIRELMEQNKDNEYCFIIGADSLRSLRSWYKHDVLVKMLPFAVVKRDREDYDFSDLIDGYNLNGCEFVPIEMPLVEISSTLIRDRVRVDKSIRYLVTEGVMGYIEEKKLYR